MKINEMYAFVATEEDGTEGIPAVRMGNTFYPLVGADMDRIESLRHLAQGFADEGVPIKLVRFSTAEILETLSEGAPAT